MQTHSDTCTEHRHDNKDLAEMLKPPIVRSGTAALNRALFTKKVTFAAAAVRAPTLIAPYRKRLEAAKQLLDGERISSVQSHPDPSLAAKGQKCLLLSTDVKVEAPETWGPVLHDGVEKEDLSVVPFEMKLDYDYWQYLDIMSSILPEELHHEIPVGFSMAGHVAHLNLHTEYLPYKTIIGQVLLDKNKHLRTVINKIETIGSAGSEFRTFPYEVLAGPDDLAVTLVENNCTFEFDFSKVYWNSRLESEHTRLISLFKPGEVVCDVMAGIGPFAVPAGKKKVFVWANDKNPESFTYLERAIKKNKVGEFVVPACTDGLYYVREAADDVLKRSREGHGVVVKGAVPRRKRGVDGKPVVQKEAKEEEYVSLPPTISHFVMNLPASAIEFLPAFRGVYEGQEGLFGPQEERGAKMPLVHVYCFAAKDKDASVYEGEIMARITKALGVEVRAGRDPDEDEDGKGTVVAVHYVRNVSPSKGMYCATFRLPREVAFAARPDLSLVKIDFAAGGGDH